MALKQDALVVAGVALVGLALVWYVSKKAGDAAGAIGETVSAAWDAAGDAVNNVVDTVGPYVPTPTKVGEKLGSAAYDYAQLPWVPTPTKVGEAIGSAAYDYAQLPWVPTPTKVGEAIGSGAYDGVEAVKKWVTNLF